jgi:hypothetical protein
VPKEFEGIVAFADTCIPLRKNSRLLLCKGELVDAERQVTWKDMRAFVKSEQDEHVHRHVAGPRDQGGNSAVAVTQGLKDALVESAGKIGQLEHPEDEELCHDCLAKLQLLRQSHAGVHAHRQFPPVKTEPMEQHAAGVPLRVSQGADGFFVFRERECGEPPAKKVKLGTDDQTLSAAGAAGVGEDVLADYQKSAVTAFTSRTEKKGKTAKAKAKAKGSARGLLPRQRARSLLPRLRVRPSQPRLS